MNLSRLLQSKKGSTLTIIIVTVLVMSIFGIVFIAVTYSSLQMSFFHSDLDKAYFAAEAGAERIAKVLDKKIGEFQEEAREVSTTYMQNQLALNPAHFRNSDGSIIVANFNQAFRENFFYEFTTKLNEWFSDIQTDEKMTELIGNDPVEGIQKYIVLEDEIARAELQSVVYEDIEYHLTVVVRGTFGDYSRRLNVKFDLFVEDTQEPYQVVKKLSVNNPTLHQILQKAIVTEKNIIIADADVNVDGDILSFGTIPSVGDEESQNATWNEYGGVIVGMTTEISDESSTLGFDPSKTGTIERGSLNVTGDVATLSHIHIVHSALSAPSTITINGDSYARAIRLQREAVGAIVSLQDTYIMDTLRVDSDGSEINVNGRFKGFVEAGYSIDGTNSGDPEMDFLNPRRTTSVVVNGNSYINFYDEVYIGGSAFLSSVTDNDGNPYMSGISAIKTSGNILRAFRQGDGSNPGDTLFWYDEGTYSTPAPAFKNYTFDGFDMNMFYGRASQPGYFPSVQRGMHFKGVWENLWEGDPIYNFYINPNHILIDNLGITSDGLLRGYSYGALMANGQVYGINNIDPAYDPVNFRGMQESAIQNFHSQISSFLTESLNMNAPKLNYVEPQKTISDYLDTTFIGENRIVENEIYTTDDPSDGFVYYGNADVDILFNGSSWTIGGEVMPVNKGIIYVDGNIYIENGFNFQGSILASGNVIFIGDSTIEHDPLVIENLLNADVNINGLFSLLKYEVPLGGVSQSQRIHQRNIEIIEWNEI